MKMFTRFGTAIALAATLTQRVEAQSSVANFEGFFSATSMYSTLGNYVGLDFTNFWGLNATGYTNAYGGGYKAVSGDMVAFGRGNTSSFSSGEAFFLKSLWIGSGWVQNYPLSLTGYRGGQQVWTRELNGQMTGATKVDLWGAQDNGLVDEVRFSSSGFEYYIDDVEILSAAHAAPEPVTMALLATGLAGVGGAGAFKRRRKSTES